jgi:hypothetical protein
MEFNMPVNVAGGTITSASISSTGQFKRNLSVTSGLIGYWDCAITSSWVDGSSTLYDLTSSGSNATAYGSIATSTFGSALGWNFDANGKYFSGTFGVGASTNASIEAWVYPAATEVTSGDRGTLIMCDNNSGSGIYHSWNKGNAYLSNYWYGHPAEGYWETAGAMTRSAWNYTCAVWNYKQQTIHQYINTTHGQGSTTVGTTSNTGMVFKIGRESPDRQFSGGIALIRYWNRALQAQEVLNNYLAEKGRFGL